MTSRRRPPVCAQRKGGARPQKRKIWPILLIVFLACCVVGGRFAWQRMKAPSAFPIRHVQVQGKFNYLSPTEISQLVESHLSGGFFSLQLASAKKIISALPWVANVSFRREWPDTLIVSVDERVPLVRFGQKGVLSVDGMIFYPASTSIPAGLPVLIGSEGDSKQMMKMYKTLDALLRVISLSVSELQFNGKNRWQLKLSNHILVILGEEDMLKRFQRFVAVYPGLAKRSKTSIVSVDLRYPDGLAVRYA